MKHRFLDLALSLLAALAVLPGLRTPIAAGGVQDVSMVALHLKEATVDRYSVCRTWAPSDVPCSQFRTHGRLGTAYYAYAVVARAVGRPRLDSAGGIAGVSLGIQYDAAAHSGVDVLNWVCCGDLEFPGNAVAGDAETGWPYAGAGNIVTWLSELNCQDATVPGYPEEGVQAIVGAFYVYAYGEDLLYITPYMSMSTPSLMVADCRATTSTLALDHRGAARFTETGAEIGFNPCTGEGEAPPEPPPPPPPPPPADPTVLLHVGSVVAPRDACSSVPAAPEDVVTSGQANPDGSALYFVYLLASPGNQTEPIGLSGLQAGIDYTESTLPTEGLKIFGWSCCAPTEYAADDWPGSRTGNTIVWGKEDCQPGPFAVAGYFYVGAYSPSTMSIVGWPGTGKVKTADCLGAEIVFLDTLGVAQIGWVSMGGAAKGTDSDGCNPLIETCSDEGVPVQPVTWGRLKTLFQ